MKRGNETRRLRAAASLLRHLACCPALTLAAVGVQGSGAMAEDRSVFPYQGIERHFVLHAAPNQTSPRPLVIALHGLNETVAGLRGRWTFDAVADREGFDVVYPEAVGGRWAYVDTRPVKLPNTGTPVDDVGFLGALMSKLVADGVAEPTRLYVVGVSNGALMAWTLACTMPDRVAGVAPLISGMVERQAEQCRSARLAPLLVLAGTNDHTQDYDGAMGDGFRLMSVPETLEFWRRLRGCAGRTLQQSTSREPRDPTAAVRVDWTDCKERSPQRFWRIEGGGHKLPSFAPLAEQERRSMHGLRSQAIETAEEVWAFFSASTPSGSEGRQR